MPPCGCMAFPATRTAVSVVNALTIDAATPASGANPASARTAAATSFRATDICTSMSAQARLTAWKEPIGRPNYSRTGAAYAQIRDSAERE